MKTFRFVAALLSATLLTPAAFPQESAEIASLMAKARRGNGIAQYNLGLAYAEGRGVTADPIEAFVWLTLARDNGARGRALDNLLAGFDRTTLATAQARLRSRHFSSSPTQPGNSTRPTRPRARASRSSAARWSPSPATPSRAPGNSASTRGHAASRIWVRV